MTTTFADSPEEMCPTFMPKETENTYAGIEGDKRVALPSMEKKEAAQEDQKWVNDAKKMFERYDENGDNCMSEQELTKLLMAINPQMNKSDIKALMKEADKNGNGKIEFNEFLDWLVAPSEELTLGRALIDKDYAKCFKVLFDAYDKDNTGTISDSNFEDCHCMLQGVFRLTGDEGTPTKADPLQLEKDFEEVFAEITRKGGSDEITFRMFTDWMKAHVPVHLDKTDLLDYCTGLATSVKNLSRMMSQAEAGLISEKDSHILEEVIFSAAEKAQEFAKGLAAAPNALADGQSQWTEPPRGLNIDKLKTMHMASVPVKPSQVKNMEFEILCLPMPGKYEDPESRVWLAEVIRRIEYKSGKEVVDHPEYYVYDRKQFKFKTIAKDDHSNFAKVFAELTPGIGIFCLLKTAANFGVKINWDQTVNALHGAQDMQLLKPDQFEKWETNMMEKAMGVLRGEGMLDPQQPGEDEAAAEKRQLTEALKYLRSKWYQKPREVMATLSMMGFVEIDPAWEDFV